jgi:hypothetical protein
VSDATSLAGNTAQPTPTLRSETYGRDANVTRARTSAPEVATARRAGSENRGFAPTSAPTVTLADEQASVGKLKAAPAAASLSVATNSAATGASFAGGSALDRAGKPLPGARAQATFQKAQNISEFEAKKAVTRFKADKSTELGAVLDNFQIEQTGNQLRVIDGDGSTYSGDLYSQKNLNEELTKGATQLKQESADAYAYRVSGTNRTLNQRVSFSWNFVAATNGVTDPVGAVGGAIQNKDALQFPALLQNSDVSGEAKLEKGGEVKFRALRVTK